MISEFEVTCRSEFSCPFGDTHFCGEICFLVIVCRMVADSCCAKVELW